MRGVKRQGTQGLPDLAGSRGVRRRLGWRASSGYACLALAAIVGLGLSASGNSPARRHAAEASVTTTPIVSLFEVTTTEAPTTTVAPVTTTMPPPTTAAPTPLLGWPSQAWFDRLAICESGGVNGWRTGLYGLEAGYPIGDMSKSDQQAWVVRIIQSYGMRAWSSYPGCVGDPY